MESFGSDTENLSYFLPICKVFSLESFPAIRYVTHTHTCTTYITQTRVLLPLCAPHPHTHTHPNTHTPSHPHRRRYRERRRANGERVNPNPIYRCLESEGEREVCFEEAVEEEEDTEPLHCEVSCLVPLYVSKLCIYLDLSIYLSIYLCSPVAAYHTASITWSDLNWPANQMQHMS